MGRDGRLRLERSSRVRYSVCPALDARRPTPRLGTHGCTELVHCLDEGEIMVALSVETPARSMWVYDRQRAEPKFWYAMYGAHVRSDVPLPLTPVLPPPNVVPAWELRL